MAITVRKLPPVLETWFLEEAKAIPTAYLTTACRSSCHLGSKIRLLSGMKSAAGWALPVTCPAGDNLATFVAIQYIMDNIGKGRWILVVNQDGESDAAMWSYMQSAMGWEVGVVGAVVAGNVRDIDEVQEKLGKEFAMFGWGGSPVRPESTPNGTIGEPIDINGVSIRAGDLIVGDSDGIVCIPRDEVESTIDRCRQAIIDDVNRLQHIREGHGPLEVLELEPLLDGNVEWQE